GHVLAPAINTIKIVRQFLTSRDGQAKIGWVSLYLAKVAPPVLFVHVVFSAGAVWNSIFGTTWTSLGVPWATIDLGQLDNLETNAGKLRTLIEGTGLPTSPALTRASGTSLGRWGVASITMIAHSKGGIDSRKYLNTSG